jgi:hypothetical protein
VVASAAAWTRETSAATAARSALGHVDAVDAVGGVERAPGLDEAAQREARSGQTCSRRHTGKKKKKGREEPERDEGKNDISPSFSLLNQWK